MREPLSDSALYWEALQQEDVHRALSAVAMVQSDFILFTLAKHASLPVALVAVRRMKRRDKVVDIAMCGMAHGAVRWEADRMLEEGAKWTWRVPDEWRTLEELTLTQRSAAAIVNHAAAEMSVSFDSAGRGRRLSLAHLPNLRKLTLEKVDFEALEIAHCPALCELSLSGVYWRRNSGMPRSVLLRDLPSLRAWRSHCGFETLEIAHCPNLTELIAHGNLRFLYLYDLPRLATLHVHSNELDDLRLPGAEDDVDVASEASLWMPERNESLRTLSIEGCARRDDLSLPAEMSALEDLAVSRTGKQSISLPRTLPRNLYWGDNRLEALSILPGQSNLECLNVERNWLRELVIGGECPNLRYLTLNRNPLSRLEHTPLLELDVAYTDILSWRELPEWMMASLAQLFAPIHVPAELCAIGKHCPALQVFSPFLTRDMDLSGLFGRWVHKNSEGFIEPKRVRLCGQPFVPDGGKPSFALAELPGVGHLLSGQYELRQPYRWVGKARLGGRIQPTLAFDSQH